MALNYRETTPPPATDRFIRQASLVPTDRARQLTAVVVGCGAIGTAVGHALARMGVGRLRLIDPDVVEPHNVTTQRFIRSDVGRPKVEALAGALRAIDPTLDITVYAEPFRPPYLKDALDNDPDRVVVFSCVDSMDIRAVIFEHARRAALFVDGRLQNAVMQVFTHQKGLAGSYEQTLFPSAEMVSAPGGGCTNQATVYCADVVAGLMVNELALWLRGRAVMDGLELSLAERRLTLGLPAWAQEAAAAS